MTQLFRNHRTIGYEAGRTHDGDTELVILRTAPDRYDTSQAFKMMPATEQDVELQIRFELGELIARARFLGLDNQRLQAVFAAELAREEG